MATTIEQKPFNLLYKYDPQKTFVDKLYDYVTVQGRYIVVTVMFIVILAFIYRFPLDKKLNDEINASKDNLELLDIYVNGNETGFQEVIERTDAANKYMSLYSIDPVTDSNGQIRFYDAFKRINEIKNEFGEEIILVDYTYQTNDQLAATINLTGYTTKFTSAEAFREKVRLEKNLFTEVLINNLGANKEGIPQFALQVKLKNNKSNG